MMYPYDDSNYNPAAPVLPVSVHVPHSSAKHVTTDGLVDTGADTTCVPKALIDTLGAEAASTCNVFGVDGAFIGPAETYFLEFEVAATRRLVEVLAIGDELILGRNLVNEFILQLRGPARTLSVTFDTP